MTRYGKITKQGILLLSYTQISGYKEVVYEDIPSEFDESTQYITQKEPEEKENHIFIGIEIHELEVDEDEGQ